MINLRTSEVSDHLFLRLKLGEKVLERKIINLWSLNYTESMIINQRFNVFDEVSQKIISFNIKLIADYVIESEKRESISIDKITKIKQKMGEEHLKMSKVFYIFPNRKLIEFDSNLLKSFRKFTLENEMKNMNEMETILGEVTSNKIEDNTIIQINLPIYSTLSINDSLKKNSIVFFHLKVLEDETEISSQEIKLKNEFLQIEEIRGKNFDDILETNIKILKNISFHLDKKCLESTNKKLKLSFSFTNKEHEEKIESLIINKNNLKNDKSIFLEILKPSYTKMIFNTNYFHSDFWVKPKGKLILHFHRLMRIEEEELNSRLIEYKEKNILFNQANDKISAFFDFDLKLQIKKKKFISQSDIINIYGVSRENRINTFEFFTSDKHESLNIKLLVLKKNGSKEGNNFDLSNSIQIESKNDEKDIEICSNKINLSEYCLKESRKLFFAVALLEHQYHENDLMKKFYEILNRKNIYAFFSLEHQVSEWSNILIKLKSIENICFKDKMVENITNKERLYFNVSIEVFLNEENLISINSFDSETLDINLMNQTNEDLNLNFNMEENHFLQLCEEKMEKYVSLIKLSLYYNGNQYVIGSRYLPFTFLSNPEFRREIDFPLVFKDVTLMDLITIKKDSTLTLNMKLLNTDDFKLSENNEKQSENIEIIDFRKNKIWDIMAEILNVGSKIVLVQILQEIHEYLVFSTKIEREVFNCLLYMHIIIIKFVNQYSILNITLQNIFGLLISDIDLAFEFFDANDYFLFFMQFVDKEVNIAEIQNPKIKETLNGKYFQENRKKIYKDANFFVNKKKSSQKNKIDKSIKKYYKRKNYLIRANFR